MSISTYSIQAHPILALLSYFTYHIFSTKETFQTQEQSVLRCPIF